MSGSHIGADLCGYWVHLSPIKIHFILEVGGMRGAHLAKQGIGIEIKKSNSK